MNNWKEKFKILEKKEEWYYEAIDLMKEFIAKNKNDRDAYLNICYCIVNAIIYKPTIDDYCDNLFNHYLEISYEKFKNDPEYLYCMAEIISYTDWIVKNANINYKEMFKKAHEIDPNNLLFITEIYNQEIFDLYKEKNPSKKEKLAEILEKKDKLEDKIVENYEFIKEKLEEIGKIGELKIDSIESFCYKKLIKSGKIKEKILQDIF